MGQAPGYGQFTGYSPMPGAQGAYLFDLVNGGKVPFAGAPAEDLRSKIDAANDARALVGAPPVNPAAARPAGPPQATTIATTKDGGRLGVKEGEDPRNIANYMVEIPGSRGSKGGLAEIGRTIQGGYELDPERMGQIQESQNAIQGGYQRGAEQVKVAMAERQAAFDAARAQENREAAVLAHENTVKQQQLDGLRAKYQAAEQEYLDTPARQKAEREGNKGKTIAEALAQAFGALGASLARTPNFAAQVVASNHEREMRQEEAELRTKKDHKDSLLGRLRDEMGSMDLARTAYRAIKTRESAMVFEQAAAKAQDVQQQQAFLQAADQQNQGYLKWIEALERGGQGEVTRSLKMQQATAARGPSRRMPTLEEHKQLKELLQADATLDKTRAEAARGGDGYRQVPHEKTSAMNALAGAISAADRIEANIKGRDMGADNTVDNPLAGGWDYLARGASSLVGDGDRKRADDQLAADTSMLARGIQTDLGKSDNDARLADEAAVGTGSAADRLRAARDTRERAIPKLRSELATMPPADQKKFFDSLPPNVQDAIMKGGQ